MLNNMKIEELKNFLQLRGLKVNYRKKRNLGSKSISHYRKQCYLSEDITRSGSLKNNILKNLS